MDWLLIRAIILCGMFAVLTYQDIRTRTTDDKVLIAFGGAGAAVYLFDYESFDMVHVGIVMIGSVIGGFLAWRLAWFGTGDILALIAASAIFPLYLNIPIIIILFMGALTLAGMFVTSVNITYNISDLIRGKLFVGVRDGPLRKTIAFIMLHRQRIKPQYVFVAQKKADDGIHINLKQTNMDANWAPRSGIGKTYVSFPPPLMPFLLIMMLIPLIITL